MIWGIFFKNLIFFLKSIYYWLSFENISLTTPRLPALLKISAEKNTANRLRKDIKQLNIKLSQLQALLEEKEAQLGRLKW